MFKYDPSTGGLEWMRRPLSHFKDSRSHKIWNTRYAGTKAGRVSSNGYIGVSINSVRKQYHCIVWEIHFGPVPFGKLIDHRNGDLTDNRIQNLRLASHSENMQNCKIQKNNTSGYKGVSWIASTNKWRSEIAVDKKRKLLGVFDCKMDAIAAYARASKLHHKEFSRLY